MLKHVYYKHLTRNRVPDAPTGSLRPFIVQSLSTPQSDDPHSTSIENGPSVIAAIEQHIDSGPPSATLDPTFMLYDDESSIIDQS